MYDYLAKVILLGPSGCGNLQGRVLSSQTIGVEFASKIIKIGTGAGRKRIKLQLWDTAGTERFRSVSRSYYRGAAGALLVYDVASRDSFLGLPTFLNDARALASPNLIVLLAGNKLDLTSDIPEGRVPSDPTPLALSSFSSRQSTIPGDPGGAGGTRRRKGSSSHSSAPYNAGAQQTVTLAADDGRQVTQEEAARWASRSSIPVAKEVSAYTGDGVEELFAQLARIILTKIELGEIDPDDPLSGIQYGDSGNWADDGSVRSATTDGGARRGRGRGRGSRWRAGMRDKRHQRENGIPQAALWEDSTGIHRKTVNHLTALVHESFLQT
ncbi:MAG: hypothetical protein LQ338_000794 [Usnochroma carphineum]|nr:MAG: hypothetical protein LQ338_000794 [Usnochroma carphineum]